MKLDTFAASLDDMMNSDRVLYGKMDVWKTDQNGIPHRLSTVYGDKLTAKIPADIAMKYKGRKITGLIVSCNACELVDGIEIHYGRPGAGGYALRVNPDDFTSEDVTSFYR